MLQSLKREDSKALERESSPQLLPKRGAIRLIRIEQLRARHLMKSIPGAISPQPTEHGGKRNGDLRRRLLDF